MKLTDAHVLLAVEFAREEHSGQFDKAGRPYIDHPMTRGAPAAVAALPHAAHRSASLRAFIDPHTATD